MELVLAVVLGACGGAALVALLVRRQAPIAPPKEPSRLPEPRPRPPEEAPPPRPGPRRQPDPPPRPPEPELRLVAYACPQCGGNVEIPPGSGAVRCTWCDAAIRVEGGREPGGARASARAGLREGPAPFEPPRPATLGGEPFGRFDAVVLRQAIHRRPREAMRWLPLDERRAGLILVRLIDPAKEDALEPEPALLTSLAEAAVESLRARRDPGLAGKAALRVLERSGAAGRLEVFAAVFDAERSQVTWFDAGCPGALIHGSLEERRSIEPFMSREPLQVLLLQGNQEAFQNRAALRLQAGDAVVVTSAAVAGEGRGWRGGQRAVHETLRTGWTGKSPAELAVALKDAFWADRERASGAHQPPAGDLLVVAALVRSNRELQGEAPAPALAQERFETALFDLAFAPGPGAFVRKLTLQAKRQALVWLEGLPRGEAGLEAGAAFTRAVESVLGGETGDNDNPRCAGREGLAAAGLEADTGVRALVLWLGDEHGKVAFWARGWRLPFELMPRGERGGNTRQFDQGGESWPRPCGRLVGPGALPMGDGTVQRFDDVGGAWTGGKASSLWEACLHHEDQADSPALLVEVARAARTDLPSAPLDGLWVLGRKPEL